MTQRIVDLLEPVEVEHQDRQAPPALPHGCGRLLQPLAQQRPVRQVGQDVVMRHVRDPGFGPLPLGDVLVRADQAAAGHGPAQDGDEPAVGQVQDLADLLAEAGNAGFDEFLRLDGPVDAVGDARLQDLPQRRPGLQLLGAQRVHFRVARVGHDHALVGIEHAQSLRHVRERRLEALVLARDLGLRLLDQLLARAAGEGRHQADAEHRDRGAGDGHRQGIGRQRQGRDGDRRIGG